jgi:2,4-diketo-3-deoxy-L-fuconate hydrolase
MVRPASDALVGLGTFESEPGERFPGLLSGDRVLDLRSVHGADATVLGLLEAAGGDLEPLIDRAGQANGNAIALDELRPCPPLQSRQILCAGANYHRHVHAMALAHLRAAEDGRSDEELAVATTELVRRLAAGDPFIFAGLPSALSGAQDDIVLWGPGAEHDWEIELAVVIGRGGRHIPTTRAFDHVAGYTIANDVSTRDLVVRPDVPMSDLLMAKSRPGFFPVGPCIVPRQAVPDPTALNLRLTLNDDVMQDDSPADLIHGIDRLIAYASTMVELLPGDLLLTGSPAGNAAAHGGRWLTPGDRIHSTISGLGAQQNLCVAPTSAGADGRLVSLSTQQ